MNPIVGYLEDESSAAQVVSAATAERARAVTLAGDVAAEDDVARLFAAAVDLGPVTGSVDDAGNGPVA